MSLTPEQAGELTGGGETSMHYHPKNVTHDDLDQLQAEMVVRTVTGNTLLTLKDDIIIADTSAGSFALTLPSAIGGKEFIITKGSAANALTIAFSEGDTIFGATTITVYNLGESKRLKAIPGGWIPL